MSSNVGSSDAISTAISSMFWQKSAIHAVPSACSRCPPVGSGAERSKTPMLSRPRKPPSNTFLPYRSLRFTHQVKFARSLPNDRFRKSTSPRPCSACSLRCRKIVAQACTGGLTSEKFHSYAGICPLGMQVHLAQHQLELGLGEVDVHGGQRHGVKRQIPRGVPRVLPLVRHGDHVGVHHVRPGVVPRLRSVRLAANGSTPCSPSQRPASRK